MSDVNFDELFGNFTAADALSVTKSEKTTGFTRDNLYKPSIKDEKCHDMNYLARVRFIPFYVGKQRYTDICRWECYLKDVNGENGIFVVSPKTIKKNCPIRELSYKLYTSDNAVDKKNSKKISVYAQWYALVEVIKDIQHPEYNGKVMIYQYGKTIHEMIETAMKDTQLSSGINPFALYDAPTFEINLTKDASKQMEGGGAVPNFSGCKFNVSQTAPIHFGDPVQELTRDRESQAAFMKWLENGAPDMKEYFFKPWDQETTDKVYANLATYKSDYVAPRTSVAAATEMVNSISENSVNSNSKPSVLEDLPDFPNDSPSSTGDASNMDVNANDEAWIANIIG